MTKQTTQATPDVVDSIFESVEWEPRRRDAVTANASPTALATRFPIADIATGVFSALASSLIDLHVLRDGDDQRARIDRRHASLAMTAAEYLRVDCQLPSSWDPLTTYFRDANGQWLYLHTGFPHLRDAIMAQLGLIDPADVKAAARACARISADWFEDDAIRRGLTVARLRTRDEWRRTEQCAALERQPLIRLTRIADSAPETPIRSAGDAPLRPLSNVKVLDFTRVLAGPIAGRTLAEHGAKVMRVACPTLPSIEPLVIDTGHGKRSAFIDLKSASGSNAMRRLAADADVIIDAYRPGSLARLGVSPLALHALRPGIIYVTISAFSNEGPWAGRRGYDTLVQATTGLAEDRGGTIPERLPCQPLDYMSGYLSAFATCVALIKRAELGGSWHIELSLARTANWLWQMRDRLDDDVAPQSNNLPFDDASAYLSHSQSKFGDVVSVAPVIALEKTESGFDRPPVPLGSDPPNWW